MYAFRGVCCCFVAGVYSSDLHAQVRLSSLVFVVVFKRNEFRTCTKGRTSVHSIYLLLLFLLIKIKNNNNNNNDVHDLQYTCSGV